MFDLIIKNGSIYDGKGSEPYQADIAISNEKIVEIGDIKGEAKKVIDERLAFMNREFEAGSNYRPNKADWLEGSWSFHAHSMP